MRFDWRPDRPSFGGIELQRYDRTTGHLFGATESTLRRPATPDGASLTDRRGHLSVRGGQSLSGLRSPSLVARRVTAKRCDFGAEMYFSPRSPDHPAGITAYYNTRNWHYLYVTATDDGSPAPRLLTRAAGRLTAHPCDLPLAAGSPVVLRAEFDGPSLRFGHDAGDGFAWLPYDLDATILSDEHADEIVDGQVKVLGFTGAMLGLGVQDLDGTGVVAAFAWSSYAAKP